MMNRIIVVAGLLALLVAPVAARADTIQVGEGVNQAEVWIEFKDGAMYTFEVAFGTGPESTVTGLELFDIIEADTTLYTVRQDYGFGVFIDGIYYYDDGNEGYLGGEDWWHYWTMETDDSTWVAPPYGAVDRIVEDGDSDGWVYGKAYPPGEVPEPASLALLLTGVAFVVRRTRATAR
ncbi:MAG TPA: PEP-CTERM sorting domain-containing protein [Phycisphaerae bacterium]|nr:PEP-CTERM sorting domain-containing protein [Phycisphaerae bacterium]